jgi:hypothetical protein
MIECHIGVCEHHICHTDLDEGPFCSLGECVKLTKEIVAMMKQAGGYANDRKAHARRKADAAAQ